MRSLSSLASGAFCDSCLSDEFCQVAYLALIVTFVFMGLGSGAAEGGDLETKN